MELNRLANESRFQRCILGRTFSWGVAPGSQMNAAPLAR